jgi:type IV pilus assembly protein PilV
MKLPFASSRSLTARQTGSYLLEALIAILIFAFGVLGLIGLLGSSIRVTNDARYRAEAANLANGMIADMWTTTPANIDTFTTAKLPAWTTKVASASAGRDRAPTSRSRRDFRRRAAPSLSPSSGSRLATACSTST